MPIAANSSQDFVPIDEVINGAIVLKDKTMQAILMASSVNFALKSSDEQAALLAQFQTFLNGLDFSIQIFIQSRRLDIRPYLAILEQRLDEQMSTILKLQTREYIEFIKNFTDNSEIMTKSFFIVIPYGSTVMARPGGITGLFGSKKQRVKSEASRMAIQEMQTQLDQRVAVVEQGMNRIGIRTIRLGTEEIIELLYKMLNPGELDKPIKLES